MQYRAYKNFPRRYREKILELQELCRKQDQTKGMVLCTKLLNERKDLPVFFLAFEKKEKALVGFLSVFLPGNGNAELNVIVHPEYRRKGIFRTLLSMAKEHLYPLGYQKLYCVLEPNGKDGVATMHAMHAKKEVSECLMHRLVDAPQTLLPKKGHPMTSLRLAEESDIPVAASMLSHFFEGDEAWGQQFLENELSSSDTSVFIFSLEEPKILSAKAEKEMHPIGVVCISCEIQDLSMYCFTIKKEYRGKGYGTLFLSSLLTFLSKQRSEGENKKQKSELILHVSDTNKDAFMLYQKAGFSIKEQQDFWRLPR